MDSAGLSVLQVRSVSIPISKWSGIFLQIRIQRWSHRSHRQSAWQLEITSVYQRARTVLASWYQHFVSWALTWYLTQALVPILRLWRNPKNLRRVLRRMRSCHYLHPVVRAGSNIVKKNIRNLQIICQPAVLHKECSQQWSRIILRRKIKKMVRERWLYRSCLVQQRRERSSDRIISRMADRIPIMSSQRQRLCGWSSRWDCSLPNWKMNPQMHHFPWLPVQARSSERQVV